MSKFQVGFGVAAAGAGGGVLFWLLSVFSNTIVFGSFPVIGRILSCAALGSGAALAGVFFLTDSDVANARTYVFAMLCGMVWQPILASSARMVANNAAGTSAAQTQSEARTLAASVPSASRNQVHKQIESTASEVNKSVGLLTGRPDAHARDQLIQAAQEGIRSVAAASSKDPEAGVEALTGIADSALKVRQPEVAAAAIASLARIGDQEKDRETKNSINRSFERLAEETERSQLPDQGAIAETLRSYQSRLAMRNEAGR